jgi:hypothetical protein
MTMIRSAPRTDLPTDAESGPGERLRRLQHRKRVLREELLVILILLAAMTATVTVLAMQWLNSGPSTSGPSVPRPTYTIIGGPA